MAETSDYEWAEDARWTLGQAVARLSAAPPTGWANARSVRGVLDGAISAQVERLSTGTGEGLDRETLTTLSADDVQTALAKHYPQAV